tara:strand:+ start:2849 stop:4615 length:1767 start_codon:yes stop_codon:yes gene_type:complete
MCGFFGFFTTNKNFKVDKKIYKNISLKYRGPDEHTVFENNNFYCEFFRLSILGGLNASQPMKSYDKKYLILLNGEIYNYKELNKDYLNLKDTNLGDTRVLVELFSKFGIKATEKLNGMFSIILYDQKKQKIYLIRDRFGTKPLYYLIKNNVLYFSSEIKGIPLKKNINNDIVTNYLDNGHYPNYKTFFKNIFNLKPSTILKFDKNEFKKIKYYDLRNHVRNHVINQKNSLEKFYELLNLSIKIRQRSNRKINFNLSGGIDSTSLLFQTSLLWSKKYQLMSSTYNYQKFNGGEYIDAKRFSDKLSIKNFKVNIYPKEIPDLSSKLQFFQDEPYGGLASVAEFKQNIELKKLGNIVSFEGVGGDEILGGYNSHLYLLIRYLHYNKKNKLLYKNLIKFSGKKIDQILKISKRFIQSNFYGNTDLSDIRFKNLKKRGIKENINYYEIIKFREIENGALYRTLRFRDRSSSACGRELRFPLLDHNLVSHSLAMPYEIKFRHGFTKYPLRNLLNQADNKLSLKKKNSTNSAQTDWLKKDLKSWAYDNIHSLNNKNVIDKKYFLNLDKQFSLKIKNSFYLWQLINLNLFYENLKK